jgi:ATP adenylyltransferase
MMLVPRAREKCGPVSCNAVIFAGTLLVRSTAELDFVRSNGPLQILQEVTLPWDTQEQ